MRLNLSFLRIFPISLFFFFLDIKKGLDSLKPLFMRFPSHLIPNFPAKSLFLFFSHFKWLDTAIAFDEITGFGPTKKATPIAIGQKPRSKSAVKISHIPERN